MGERRVRQKAEKKAGRMRARGDSKDKAGRPGRVKLSKMKGARRGGPALQRGVRWWASTEAVSAKPPPPTADRAWGRGLDLPVGPAVPCLGRLCSEAPPLPSLPLPLPCLCSLLSYEAGGGSFSPRTHSPLAPGILEVRSALLSPRVAASLGALPFRPLQEQD